MNLSNRDFDDLKLIKGIGPARQRWFKRTLDVRTFKDLAALSVDEIESRLKVDNQIASRESIEAWIAQAHRRTEKATKATRTNKKGEKSKISTRRREENFEVPKTVDDYTERKAQSPIRGDGWKPFASFIIEYQEHTSKGQVKYRTTAHHIEADNSTSWIGIEGELHCQWMLEQLGDRENNKSFGIEYPIEKHPAKRETRHLTKDSVVVRITEIRTFQPQKAGVPLGTGKPAKPFGSNIKCDIPFALEAHFELTGEPLANMSQKHIIFRARAYVQEQSTEESIYLGDMKSDIAVNGEIVHVARIPNIILPAGTYRLFVIVTVQSESVTPDFITLPEFKVIG